MRIPDPFKWLTTAQNWFSKTERSSGFRPFLIFFLIFVGALFCLLMWFPDHPLTRDYIGPLFQFVVIAFVLLYVIKSLQDPDFCRSEKHVEAVKRIEIMEQKGDKGPTPIDVTTTQVIPNPQSRKLSQGTNGGEQ